MAGSAPLLDQVRLAGLDLYLRINLLLNLHEQGPQRNMCLRVCWACRPACLQTSCSDGTLQLLGSWAATCDERLVSEAERALHGWAYLDNKVNRFRQGGLRGQDLAHPGWQAVLYAGDRLARMHQAPRVHHVFPAVPVLQATVGSSKSPWLSLRLSTLEVPVILALNLPRLEQRLEQTRLTCMKESSCSRPLTLALMLFSARYTCRHAVSLTRSTHSVSWVAHKAASRAGQAAEGMPVAVWPAAAVKGCRLRPGTAPQ